MSEAVEAVVIEPEEASELTVAYSPAVIEANFDALEAHVRKLVADYKGATYDMSKDENVKAAKRDRTYLNGIAKQIDERRKAVAREYTAPLAAFEDRCKAVAGIAKQTADGIKAQLDDAEAERQACAYAKLQEHYEEFAGLLAPVVPYERFHEKQWLNKTFGEAKAFKALEKKVSNLAQDWETLKAQFEGEPFYDEAERELFATLDLGAAITAAHKAAEERQRIAELKAAMEPEPVEEAEPEAETPEQVANWYARGGFVEAEASPVQPEEWQEQLPASMADNEAQPAPIPAPPAPPAPAPVPMAMAGDPWTIVVPCATREQMQGVAAALKAQGVIGTIMHGTVGQVYERMNGGY
ncbi:DUF1351 domain-containing protein [uncultured Senegalimassilia sp.]|uniref:DUF1351 domain-containing protein n=1 Tax=uncultured Senegalimassilia sp. TaxID=1714350 RepID=UPI0025FCA06E|nr:DUF1351 domain-containing protein [uncultured Senegalimassilia sp.]